MSFSTLPLSYCTNVHPGLTVFEVIDGLKTYTGRVRRECGQVIAAGLWLAAPVIAELRSNDYQLALLQETLEQENLLTYTLNTFPYGNFHQAVVKDQVYLPNWSQPERLQYTIDCGLVLADLLPSGIEGSLSTVPLGFKGHVPIEDREVFQQRCIENLLKLVKEFDHVHDETGQVIRLAIEPEPFCILETTIETIRFFQKLFDYAEKKGMLIEAKRHLGVCYDVCHQSVEFEDVAQSIKDLQTAGIRINKVHITCAVELSDAKNNHAGLQGLKHFQEPRYLHQTFGKTSQGEINQHVDLLPELWDDAGSVLHQAETVRVHYHVPVNEESIGLLGTTRHDLIKALKEIRNLDYAPHLEIETYTWGVLPGSEMPGLVEGITKEFKATWKLLGM